jgi:hypothetical protein
VNRLTAGDPNEIEPELATALFHDTWPGRSSDPRPLLNKTKGNSSDERYNGELVQALSLQAHPSVRQDVIPWGRFAPIRPCSPCAIPSPGVGSRSVCEAIKLQHRR